MKSTTIAAACLVAIATASPANAQYPEQQIRIVVPFGPGGITDLVARQVGERLSGVLGQTVLIENLPGAGGTIAAQSVATSDPDGYTLFMGTVGSQVVNPLVRSEVGYDPETSFEPIGLVAGSPFVIAVRADLGVSSYQEFIDYARTNPGELNFGSAGVASSPHLGLELLKIEEDVDIAHIPFNSGSQAVNAAAGGEIDVTMDAVAVVMPQVEGGLLTPLVLGASERLQAAPDVPSNTEVGADGLEVTSWNALYVPAGTSEAIVSQLNEALMEALSDEELIEAFSAQGSLLYTGSLEEHRAFVDAERERWTSIVEGAGISIE